MRLSFARARSSFVAVVTVLSAAAASSVAGCESKQPAAAPASTPNAASPNATDPLGPPTLTTRFDAAKGELPEGLVVDGGSVFVGFAPSSKISRVDLASGTASAFGTLPAPVSGKGFMTGLARGADGSVFAGLASFVPEVQAGLYRVPPEGGAATLVAKDAAMPFPNALAVDGDGAIWITDSGTGSVFRLPAGGTLERWVSGDLLTGKKYTCGAGLGPGFDIGANGVVVERDAVYVVNTDKATLVRIPRDAGGKAGVPKIVAGPDCESLGGADGLARAPDGSFVVALNRQDKLVRVSATGTFETIAKGAPLDFPASVAFRGSDLYVTNFALFTASAGKPTSPALVKLSP